MWLSSNTLQSFNARPMSTSFQYKMGPRKTRRQSSQIERYNIPLNQSREDWREAFEKFFPDENDEVAVEDVLDRLKVSGDKHGIGEGGIAALVLRADKDKNGRLSFDEFYDGFVGAQDHAEVHRPLIRRAVRTAAFFVAPKSLREDFRLKYANQYSFIRHPPIFMLAISLLEIGVFISDSIEFKEKGIPVTAQGPMPKESWLIYNPFRRYENWRYVTYMLVHAGYFHIVGNVVSQLALGIILEIFHTSWRVMAVYFSGVVAGSLAVSIFEPKAYLFGASGGTYALITAHVATVVTNWSEMEFPSLRIILTVAFAPLDVGVAIHNFRTGQKTQVSYSAHVAGAVAGLLVGIFALRNLRKLYWERVVSRICLHFFIALMFGAVGFNVYFPQHFFDPQYNCSS